MPTPEWSGHGFRGWWTAQEGGTEVTAETTVNTTEAHTLYAHWVQLKTIPASVFSFTNKTVTYDKTPQAATYTFNPDSLTDCPDENSFTIEYIRVSDGFIAENTPYDEPQATAGTYNVHITRAADDTYAKFDQNYNGVLVIDRAARVAGSITDNDITLEAVGFTFLNVTLDTSKIDNYEDEHPDINYYVGNYVYKAEDGGLGFIYDLVYGSSYTIKKVGIPGTINYLDAEFSLSKSFRTKDDPSGSWSDHADTSWYNSTDTEFTITTAAQLAGLAKLVNNGNTFAGKTVKLGGDIDLSQYEWVGIGKAMWVDTLLFKNPPAKPFAGAFDGCNHTVSGVYVHQEYAVGFFGVIQDATIQNFRLTDALIVQYGSNYGCGGMVGRVHGTSKLINCYSSAATDDIVNDKANTKDARIFGAKGWSTDLTTEGCEALALRVKSSS